jgi:hypothetical protein
MTEDADPLPNLSIDPNRQGRFMSLQARLLCVLA